MKAEIEQLLQTIDLMVSVVSDRSKMTGNSMLLNLSVNSTYNNISNGTTTGVDDNSLLETIQNVFAIVYMMVYLCGLIFTSIYAIYMENETNTQLMLSAVIHNNKPKGAAKSGTQNFICNCYVCFHCILFSSIFCLFKHSAIFILDFTIFLDFVCLRLLL